MHIKCVTVNSNTECLLFNLFVRFQISRTQDMHFPQNSGKKFTKAPLAMLAKITSGTSFKVSILRAKFCTIPCKSEIELSLEFREKQNSSVPYLLMLFFSLSVYKKL